MEHNPESHYSAPSQRPSGSSGVGAQWIATGIVVVVAIVIVILALAGTGPFGKTSSTSSGSSSTGATTVPPASSWAAVFLGDNEVFFGHVKNAGDQQVELTTVYYLQKTSASGTGTGTATSNASQASQLSLAGLVGNQIQCPKDDLVINRNAILYYQELQSSSYVVQKLQQLTQTPQKCVQPSTASPTPAPAAN